MFYNHIIIYKSDVSKTKMACQDWDWDFTYTSLNFETETFHLQYQSSILRLKLSLIGLTVWDQYFIFEFLVSMVETET